MKRTKQLRKMGKARKNTGQKAPDTPEIRRMETHWKVRDCPGLQNEQRGHAFVDVEILIDFESPHDCHVGKESRQFLGAL